MKIEQIKELTKKPELYEKGSSVMWTDPHISKQLLEFHINPEHDVASRSKGKIKAISNWILEQSSNPKMKILDLGCGPGLYSEYFAQRGHSVTGIDFSQNSIQYAKQRASEKKLDIEYLHKDYLDMDLKNQFDLIIMICLDFCILLPNERDKLLTKINGVLKNRGLFICDVVNEKNIDKKIIPQSWEAQNEGFWKDSPYIALANGYHYPEKKVIANHHIVIGDNGEVETYIFWSHYYEKNDLIPIFESTHFAEIKSYENVLPPSDDFWNGENITFYVAGKQ